MASVGPVSKSTLFAPSHRHMVVSSVPANRSNSHRGIGNRLGGRPVTSRQMARHVAPDGPARLDGLDVAGENDFASDEAVRIAEGLGDDDGQILHRQPPHRLGRSHELWHEVPDGGGREELGLGHQFHERGGVEDRCGQLEGPDDAATSILVSQEPTPLPLTPGPAPL
jgi:hypothetical protein